MTQQLSETNPVHRREVSWDPGIGLLTVGKESAVIEGAHPTNGSILRTYLDLVARQRRISLDHSVILRRDDIAVLCELLDLEDERLEADLVALLRITPAAASRLHRRLLGRRLAVGALGISVLAGLPLSQTLMDPVGADAGRPTSLDVSGRANQIDIGEPSVTFAPLDSASPFEFATRAGAGLDVAAIAASETTPDAPVADAQVADASPRPIVAPASSPVSPDGGEASGVDAIGVITPVPTGEEPGADSTTPTPTPVLDIGTADVVERDDHDRNQDDRDQDDRVDGVTPSA